MKYKYSGAFTTITIDGKDICLHNNKNYELSEKNELVKKYKRRGYLSPVKALKITKNEKEVNKNEQ